jgi:hypothetical protein
MLGPVSLEADVSCDLQNVTVLSSIAAVLDTLTISGNQVVFHEARIEVELRRQGRERDTVKQDSKQFKKKPKITSFENHFPFMRNGGGAFTR